MLPLGRPGLGGSLRACRWWGTGVAIWAAFSSFCRRMKFWDGSVQSSLVQAQAAVSAPVNQFLAAWSPKLPAWKIQGFMEVV